MIRANVARVSIAIVVIGVIVGGLVGCTKEIEVTKTVEVTEEVPMTLATVAEKIRSGEIDVGTEHGFGLDQRYHKIHATALGLKCAACHISEPNTTQTVFDAQDVSPQAPGPVDKRACLGCHRAGPGGDVYDSAAP